MMRAIFPGLALLVFLVLTGFGPPGAGSLMAAVASAQTSAPVTGPVRVDSVEAELVAEQASVVPGSTMRIGVRLRHDPQWHTYWRNPGDSGLPTRVDLALPEGFSASAIHWPAPQRLFIPPLANYGYEGEIVLPIDLAVPPSLPPGDVRLAAHVSWLVCRDVCIPGDARLALVLPVQRDGAPAKSRFASLFAQADAQTPRGTIDVGVWAAEETMSIVLPGRAAAVEFFPYEEGLIDNAADQVLQAAQGAHDGMVLRVQLSGEGARRLANESASVLASAAGVVVIDGQAAETGPRLAEQAPLAGAEIGRAPGAAAQPLTADQTGGNGASGGWLAGLTSQLRSESIDDAAAAGVPAAGQPVSGKPVRFASATLWIAVVSGLVGGLILNLMPCVFPVIGLKVLDFTRNADRADAGSRLAALAFAAGVIASFWALAGLLLLLRAGGEAAGWGFQLQSPGFVAAMALLFVLIGLNFSGVFEIGLTMTRLGTTGAVRRPDDAGSATRASWTGSFGTGVLAVLVATPCTAPFMGSAMGFTLASSGVDAMIVFTAIAIGMTSPYVLLGFFPQALRVLPRPGRWMESFRQFLAFPMYATAAWLAWVLGQQVGIDAVLALSAGAVLLGFAAWLYGRFVQHPFAARSPQRAFAAWRRASSGALAVVSVIAAIWVAWPPAQAARASSSPLAVDRPANDETGWNPWSAEAVRQARAEARPVFVEFTAAWCVSCQVNKRLVLDRASIITRMNELGVVRFRADWTNRDPAITGALAGFGRNGVPLYLLYRPGSDDPQVLPEILTPGIVRDALTDIAS